MLESSISTVGSNKYQIMTSQHWAEPCRFYSWDNIYWKIGYLSE